MVEKKHTKIFSCIYFTKLSREDQTIILYDKSGLRSIVGEFNQFNVKFLRIFKTTIKM